MTTYSTAADAWNDQRVTDKQEYDSGYTAGNYAEAYEGDTLGKGAYYRMGYLLGFYATYELSELPGAVKDDVEERRAQVASWGWKSADRGQR